MNEGRRWARFLLMALLYGAGVRGVTPNYRPRLPVASIWVGQERIHKITPSRPVRPTAIRRSGSFSGLVGAFVIPSPNLWAPCGVRAPPAV